MACAGYGSGSDTLFTIFGIDIDAKWVQFAFQALLTYLLLKEQKDAEEALERTANCSITSAEELYDAYYDLREYDQQIYDQINELPSYKKRDVKPIQSKREATKFLSAAMGSTNRFECGARDQILRETMRATIVSDALEQENLEQQEILAEDTYYENCILAKIGIASADMPNISGSLTTAGALWASQLESTRSDAVGAVAGLAYQASSLFAPQQGQFQVGIRGSDGANSGLLGSIGGLYG